MSHEIELDIPEMVSKLSSTDPYYKHIYLFPTQGIQINIELFVSFNGYCVYQVATLDSFGDLTDIKSDVVLTLEDAIARMACLLENNGFTVRYAIE